MRYLKYNYERYLTRGEQQRLKGVAERLAVEGGGTLDIDRVAREFQRAIMPLTRSLRGVDGAPTAVGFLQLQVLLLFGQSTLGFAVLPSE